MILRRWLTLPCLSKTTALRFGSSRLEAEFSALNADRPGIADHAEERRRRHLDTMHFVTELVARVPRCRCPEHGVKTVIPPWAAKHSRFTLLFESLAGGFSICRARDPAELV